MPKFNPGRSRSVILYDPRVKQGGGINAKNFRQEQNPLNGIS